MATMRADDGEWRRDTQWSGENKWAAWNPAESKDAAWSQDSPPAAEAAASQPAGWTEQPTADAAAPASQSTGWGEQAAAAAPAAAPQSGAWADQTAAPAEAPAAAAHDAWAAASPAPQKEDAWQPRASGDAWAAGEQAAPQADAWGKKKEDAWGNFKKEDAWGKQTPDGEDPTRPTKAYWDQQNWNKRSNTLPGKTEAELLADEERLFDQSSRSQAGLNFAKYDSVPVDISGTKADKIPVCSTFEDLYKEFRDFIPEALEHNLRKCNYEVPTPVQKFAVPMGLVGRDVMCCAQTGSGKTAAFMIPVLGSMMKNHQNSVGAMQVPFEGVCSPDSLVLTPTRELCIQISEEAQKFLHRTPYRVVRVYGGEMTKVQMVELARGADLIVATPWRLLDFINRKIVAVDKCHVLVLDEADRMLEMGFEEQIREIVEKNNMPTKDSRQTLMFSATFPEKCQKMAADFLHSYIWIAIGVIGSAVETVEQNFEKVDKMKKFDKLMEKIDEFYEQRGQHDRMLVFVNARDTAKWLDEQLFEKHKVDTGALYSDLTQQVREQNLMRFRKGEIDVMVATDVASRGLDIPNVTMVVNYDMPKEIDTYVQRIGRTGRIGNEGKAITFISFDERGACLESPYILKDLTGVVEKSRANLPEWLAEAVKEADGASSSWSWGNKAKDVRADQQAWRGTTKDTAWTNWGDAAAATASAGADAGAATADQASAAASTEAAGDTAGRQDNWQAPPTQTQEQAKPQDPWHAPGSADPWQQAQNGQSQGNRWEEKKKW